MEAKAKITLKLFLAHQSARKWWKSGYLNRYCYLKSQKGEIVCRKIWIKRKKILEKRVTENRVGWPFNSELGSKNASLWSSAKGLKNCFRNAPINYRQTMPDDRFTSVKMNITRSRWSWLQMTLLQNELKTHVLDFYKVTFQCPFFFSCCKALQLTFITGLKN